MYLWKLVRQPTRSIVSFRNAGLGDNLLAAANAWYYAKMTGRSLILCWVASRYQEDLCENAFWQLFLLPPRIDSVPIIKVSRVDRVTAHLLAYRPYLWPYPDVLSIAEKLVQKLARSPLRRYLPVLKVGSDLRLEQEQRMVSNGIETRKRVVIARGCYPPRDGLKPFFDALTLTPDLAGRVSTFASTHFAGKKVIGVHIRHYNPALPPSNHAPYWVDNDKALSVCFDKIEEAISRAAPEDYVVFLATDSSHVQDALVARFNGIVTLKKRFGTDVMQELHDELPIETLTETVLEMFLLAKSDVLVRYPPNSWFPNYASYYAREVVS